MICLYAETQLSNFTLILYTFVITPFLQFTQTVGRILAFLIDPHHQIESSDDPQWEIDLPGSQWRGGEVDEEEEMCSICLMEFLSEEMVNRLPRCGHVFHIGCLEKWLDRCQFTCPLCRASVLQIRSASTPCKKVGFCVSL